MVIVMDWDGDALVEYQPHMTVGDSKLVRLSGYINPYYAGTIEDISDYINNLMYFVQHRSENIFRSALTSWDNTARKCLTSGRVFAEINPHNYKQWLKDDIMIESPKNT